MSHRPALALAALALAVPATALAAGTRTVSVKDNVFVAKSLTISRGTTVRWVWRGKHLHNVTVVKGPATFRSGTKKTGTFTRTFNKPGTYKLLCTVHAPDMKMTLTVR